MEFRMSTTPRIALIHALKFSIAPIEAAFAELWPQTQLSNILDDSLSIDRAAAKTETEAIQGRMRELADYGVRAGAEAILFTCSAFGQSIDRVKAQYQIPVLKPNEAMVEEVTALGGRVGVIATFAPTLETIEPEFDEEARRQGIDIALELVHAEGAFECLTAGDLDGHDQRITEAARSLAGCDTIVLSQYSMARAGMAVADATGVQTFTTPGSAVRKLKQLLVGDNHTG
jgi:aspartate/glutamate racemase